MKKSIESQIEQIKRILLITSKRLLDGSISDEYELKIATEVHEGYKKKLKRLEKKVKEYEQIYRGIKQ